jgi:hypothetical protein
MVFTSVDVTTVLIRSRNAEIKHSLPTYCEISREYFIRLCLLSKLFMVAGNEMMNWNECVWLNEVYFKIMPEFSWY